LMILMRKFCYIRQICFELARSMAEIICGSLITVL
jgi:hypothetical protein